MWEVGRSGEGCMEVQWDLAGSSQWKMRELKRKLKRGYEGAEGVSW